MKNKLFLILVLLISWGFIVSAYSNPALQMNKLIRPMPFAEQ